MQIRTGSAQFIILIKVKCAIVDCVFRCRVAMGMCQLIQFWLSDMIWRFSCFNSHCVNSFQMLKPWHFVLARDSDILLGNAAGLTSFNDVTPKAAQGHTSSDLPSRSLCYNAPELPHFSKELGRPGGWVNCDFRQIKCEVQIPKTISYLPGATHCAVCRSSQQGCKLWDFCIYISLMVHTRLKVNSKLKYKA